MSFTLHEEGFEAVTLTIELSEKQEAALKAQAPAKGVSEADFVQKVLDQILEPAVIAAPEEQKTDQSHRPLSARIREMWADMPDDVRAKLPADGASQHDHYIYGIPKRDQ